MLPLADLCSQYAWPIVLAAIGLYVAHSVRSWYRLRQFNGPWLAKHSYLWLLRAVTNNKLHLTFPELHKKYGEFSIILVPVFPHEIIRTSHHESNIASGSIVRIGPNDLVTNDAELLRRMSGARSAYLRSSWYSTQEVDTRGLTLSNFPVLCYQCPGAHTSSVSV